MDTNLTATLKQNIRQNVSLLVTTFTLTTGFDLLVKAAWDDITSVMKTVKRYKSK